VLRYLDSGGVVGDADGNIIVTDAGDVITQTRPGNVRRFTFAGVEIGVPKRVPEDVVGKRRTKQRARSRDRARFLYVFRRWLDHRLPIR